MHHFLKHIFFQALVKKKKKKISILTDSSYYVVHIQPHTYTGCQVQSEPRGGAISAKSEDTLADQRSEEKWKRLNNENNSGSEVENMLIKV